MQRFPSEFADLLNRRGRRILSRGWTNEDDSDAARAPLALFRGLIDKPVARRCQELLDECLRSHVRPLASPIPLDSIWGMTANYSESLVKTMRQKTVALSSSRSRVARQAHAVGLLPMLRSASLTEFAEAVTGMRLERCNGLQALLYEHGDYVGPHNDHHPEQPHLRSGYVDLHLSFVNDAVGLQQIVCEGPDRHLNVAFDATSNGSIAVYRLPFWHYATPLQGRRGRESDARRWLLMASHIVCSSAPTGNGQDALCPP